MCRYLADLMDNPDLIRNVVLAGHLHTGKVYYMYLMCTYIFLIVLLCFTFTLIKSYFKVESHQEITEYTSWVLSICMGKPVRIFHKKTNQHNFPQAKWNGRNMFLLHRVDSFFCESLSATICNIKLGWQ